MDGWMNEWMNGWMDRWMNGWLDGRTDGRMDGWFGDKFINRLGGWNGEKQPPLRYMDPILDSEWREGHKSNKRDKYSHGGRRTDAICVPFVALQGLNYQFRDNLETPRM